MIVGLKRKAMLATEDFRLQVRRRLNPEKIQRWVQNDQSGAFGLASGAFVGALL